MGIGFKTTNPIESVLARVEAHTARVDLWLLAVEARFRWVKGYQLPALARLRGGIILDHTAERTARRLG